MALFMRAAMRSLSTRLFIGFVAVIVATAVLAGGPAYWLVRRQLERQAWARVEDGGRVTLTLLEVEEDRLRNLVELTAQRPTLQNLLRQGDADTLSGYLQNFQASVGLDILVVRDPSGRLVASGAPASPWPEPPLLTGVAFRTLPSQEPGLALLASQRVFDNRSGNLIGYVTLGDLFDDDFTRRLAVSTGFEQGVVLDGARIATSLEDVSWSPQAEVVERVTSSGQPEAVEVKLSGARYYTMLLPILDTQDKIVALAEVALSVDDVVTAEREALLTLAFSTLLVALLGLSLSGLYTRRLTAPLRQLTIAASGISRGDLATPVPIPDEPAEIATLAVALEESRVNIRRMLDNLAQAKTWSETLIQSIVEGVVTIDAKGRIAFFSQGAERITGWSSHEVQGKSLNEVLRLADDEDGQFVDQMPPRDSMRQIEVMTRSGRPVTLAVTGARLAPPISDTVQVALVLRDITEEEAGRNLRSYFLTNVSHEFRTPLSAINASVELLLEEAEHIPLTEMGELLNSIHLSVGGLQTLIDNLLESTSIEAGHFSIRRRPTDFDEVVNDALRVMQPLLNRRQQRLSLNRPARFPMITADPTRLTQVLVNLLSNASKYSPMGKLIDLSLELTDGGLRVEVADRGPGIPPVVRTSIFRRFVRLDAEDETQYGIGLGLSVVKAIVEGHGGEVGVDERPGGGSIFWFTIPLVGSKA